MSSLNGSLDCSIQSTNRKLQYRTLIENVQNLSVLDSETADCEEGIEKTQYVVQKTRELFEDGTMEERVRHPGENYLNSQVVCGTSDLAMRYTAMVTGYDNKYKRDELAQHILENPSFWDFPFPLEAPAMVYLHGTFAPTAPEHRPRAAPRRVERQRAAPLKAPKNLDKVEKKDDGTLILKRIEKILRHACAAGPVSYFHAVLDPTSFTRTVENIYHLAFLVKDNKISVQLDESTGLPYIQTVPQENRRDRDSAGKTQFIVSVDMRRWQQMIDALNIQEPMLVFKRN